MRDSSEIPTRQGRAERLADLAAATGSTHCLCGTGGLRYLDAGPFDAHGIPVLPPGRPTRSPRSWTPPVTAGISDTLALGILCEGYGMYLNSAQVAHPAYRRSLGFVDRLETRPLIT